MTSKKKLTALSLKEKLNMIKEIEEDKIEKKVICLKYKCDISTVNRILKKKYEIIEAVNRSANLTQKRNRKGVHDNVEKALWLWYNEQRQNNVVVNSTALVKKAKEFAIEFGNDFAPDNTWLFRWKKRHNIRLETNRDLATSNKDSAQSYKDHILPEVIKEYSPENIMNAGESALFYKALPTKTYLRPDFQPFGHKSQKERFTLLFICNATATFKRVYVIGKSKNLQYFKNVIHPVPYFCNEKALMTTTLWQEILHSLDIEMQALNQKIVLFVDNGSCHKTPCLRNIVVNFLPPNITSLIQPLGRGIMSDFKAHYRQIIVKKQISALERYMTIEEFYKSISYLDALHFIKRAWWLVSPSCISNCFRKSGFVPKNAENYLDTNAEVDFLSTIPDCMDYIRCDDGIECSSGDFNESDTIDNGIKSEPEIDIESDTQEDLSHIPSLKEALEALNVVQKYCFFNNIDISVDQIETEMVKGAVADPLNILE